jgi:hypothetical protein
LPRLIGRGNIFFSIFIKAKAQLLGMNEAGGADATKGQNLKNLVKSHWKNSDFFIVPPFNIFFHNHSRFKKINLF